MSSHLVNALTHDAEARAQYVAYQDALIGPDALAEDAFEWPDLPARILKRDALKGWRAWAVITTDDGPRLSAPYNKWHPAGLWPTDAHRSSSTECTADVPYHPHPACRCGLRAVQSWTVMRAFLNNQSARADCGAAAVVEAWGRVAPFAGDDDWRFTCRAERVQIWGILNLHPEHAEHADALAEHYRTEVDVVELWHRPKKPAPKVTAPVKAPADEKPWWSVTPDEKPWWSVTPDEKPPTTDLPRPPTSARSIDCECGEKHWGALGAAGVLLVVDGRALMQLRSSFMSFPRTWGIPGGALDPGEFPTIGAFRETHEEVDGLDALNMHIVGHHVDDHGGWAYTTILAVAAGTPPAVTPRGPECDGVIWKPLADVPSMRLHPGLRDSWPALLAQLVTSVDDLEAAAKSARAAIRGLA